ncbi:hypothetical protein L208DRAFT_1253653 [Tricholoma matsutake]|nr:hypothetical protein L208DRAFT_1253653 [Tricholoma matsutake 945]
MLTAFSLSLLLSSTQLSHAINVYLNTQSSFLGPSLSPADATSELSRHLGLESFEPFPDVSQEYPQESFVGRGQSNALLLTIDEEDAEAVLPPSIRPSFKLAYPSYTPISSLSSVVSTYLHRARHIYTSVYTQGLSWQLDDVDSLSDFFESAEGPAFAAIEVRKLSDLRQTNGPKSEQYSHAADKIRAFLTRTYDKSEELHIALLTFTSSYHSRVRRDPAPQESQSPFPPNHPPPQEPIGSISTCFTSADTCTNGTNSCSGRGQCVEASKSGRTCFICTCGVTRTGEGSKVKTDRWAGQSCERKDVSGPFVLLAGTVLVLFLLIFGSISLLSGVGNHELPSTLLATAVNGKRD